MEAYCDAKAELFARCEAAVFNRDDLWFKRITALSQCPRITYSAKGEAGIFAENVELLSDGIRFMLTSDSMTIPVAVPIPGRFTVYNTLTVLGILKALGIDLKKAVKALETVQGVKGRIEVVPTPGKDYTLLIDYAHTPDGLKNILDAIRGFAKGRIVTLFGCGGDRDKTKRPQMGKIAGEMSDFCIITSDNPRSEEPCDIIEDILVGIKDTGCEYKVIENRFEAIEFALDNAHEDDIILLAGKGHEPYQILKDRTIVFDEREIVLKLIDSSEG
jgi:UDP-N-acetylmuramoyl-L-alanyl-D-glutamate--2,6-diaminopimelate ligase